jgi:bile acid-coenzyme A ligase
VSVLGERIRQRAVDGAGTAERAAGQRNGPRTRHRDVALIAESGDATRIVSGGELWCEVRNVADVITTTTSPDGVVLVQVDNGIESVLSLIAALVTDRPVAVVSRRAPDAEKRALRDALLADGHDIALVRDRAVSWLRAHRPCRRRLGAESVLLATGGSAGRPKVVVDPRMRTVGARPRVTRPSTAMNWRPGQRQLVVGPLYHTAALTYFIEAMSDGNTVAVQRVFDPAQAMDLIEHWAIEWMQLTPYHLRLLGSAARSGSRDLSSLRGVLHLSAPCPEKVKRMWLDLVGEKSVFEMYGATEPVGVTLARGDEWNARQGTVGKGFFTQLRILDEAGRPMRSGSVGDVYMRSGAVAASYLDPAQRFRLTPDGFASLGDRGRLDADGYLYLEPRQVRRIQVGGETVYADEVESVLVRHPRVLDAAVIGVEDDRLGETVVAVVVPSGQQVDTREIRDFARDRLARHKVPRNVIISNHVPRAGTGKLNHGVLADMVRDCGPRKRGGSGHPARIHTSGEGGRKG